MQQCQKGRIGECGFNGMQEMELNGVGLTEWMACMARLRTDYWGDAGS